MSTSQATLSKVWCYFWIIVYKSERTWSGVIKTTAILDLPVFFFQWGTEKMPGTRRGTTTRQRCSQQGDWRSSVSNQYVSKGTASNFIALILTHLFIKCWQFSLELNSKRLYQSSGKEKESCSLVFTSSTKHEIRHFHILVVQWRQRNVQSKGVMHVQSCGFANLNLCFFAILVDVAVIIA